jgi:O-antigen/teichoic acid export membrane protein
MEVISAAFAINLRQLITFYLSVCLSNIYGVVFVMLLARRNSQSRFKTSCPSGFQVGLESLKECFFFFFAGLASAIWKNRNKLTIEKIFPSNLDVVIYATINSMQMWGELLKEVDKGKMLKVVRCLSDWLNKEKHPDMSSHILVL